MIKCFFLKKLLKEVLAERQLRALSHFKNKTLPNVRRRLGQSPFLLLGSVVKALPGNSQVTVKSGINVVKRMDYDGADVFLAIDSDMEYRVRLHSCKKEPDTVEWIESFFSQGDVLFDVGANVGVYSLVASKFLGGKVEVYAFEPAFPNFAQLCKNLVLNGCQESIIALQIALSNETGLDKFNYYSLVPGGAVHALGEAVDFKGDDFNPVSTQRVLKYRADDFVTQFGVPKPNHVKIDVDGTEFSVLQGMSSILAGPTLRTLMVEVNEAEARDHRIVEYLSKHGLEIHSKHGLNHLFVRMRKG